MVVKKSDAVSKDASKGVAVKKGDVIKVEYEGKLEDGTVFDCSANHNGQPLEFEVGSGKIIKGFDDAVTGMKSGEEKTITLKPEQAYGQPNQMLIQKMPRSQMPKDQEPKAGMVLFATMPTGEQIPAKITMVDKDSVTLDFNHPLSGKTLTFRIKVTDVKAK